MHKSQEEQPTQLKSKRSLRYVTTIVYTNRAYMNKMGVGMTWLRSLPNCQHHPSLAYHAITRHPPHHMSKRMCLHQHSRQAHQNPLPNQQGGISHCRFPSVYMTLEPGEPMVQLFLLPQNALKPPLDPTLHSFQRGCAHRPLS